jgi:hypothetical protein
MSSDCSRVVRRITTTAGNDFSPSQNTNQVGMITEILKNESLMMKSGWDADNSHCASTRESFLNIRNLRKTNGLYPGLFASGILLIGLFMIALAITKKR